jgi:hypothetical protein
MQTKKKRRPNRTTKELFDDAVNKAYERLEKEVRLTGSSKYMMKYFASLVAHFLNGNPLEELGCPESYWNKDTLNMACPPQKSVLDDVT